jgi:methyl-accepting chemotaxis protein
VDMLETSIIPARNRFLDAVASQKEWQIRLLNDVSQASVERGQFTETLVMVVAIITAALGFLIAILFSRYLMRQLGGEPQDAVAAVQAVAYGDLTRAVHVRTGDRTSVMAAVADMRERLTQLVSQVRRGVDTVATASSEIASGNADLSQRTEQQASGLQEAASSMQQLTDSVHASAGNAAQASRVAAQASEAAKSGAAAMTQVVSTMGEIEASSSRIGDIVSTIDGIAFQTNILALNAAVEAARAGESGRGFAVVAAEVRALAQRSASAAREVKSLITASSEKVESGNRLVTNAGEHMSEILTRVSEVQALIVEIHNASDAQALRIDAVGNSVSQVDQMTQQNAALVEQSAAAAEGLKHQSAQLAQAADAFRIHSPLQIGR